jgi:DNA-binding response OmpR family regulator
MKVLVVDDSPDAAEPLVAFLGHEGHEVYLAHGPSEALRIAIAFQPDLALLDIGLPLVDGWHLGGMLRGLPGLAGLRMIAITGYGTADDHQRSRDACFEHHLVKPIDYEVLAAVLRGQSRSDGF